MYFFVSLVTRILVARNFYSVSNKISFLLLTRNVFFETIYLKRKLLNLFQEIFDWSRFWRRNIEQRLCQRSPQANQFIDFPLPREDHPHGWSCWPEVRPGNGWPPALGFSISHNVWAWSIGVLEKRGRDKIGHGPIPGEFTPGISSPYIWASTGNATILSGPGSWRSIREMLSPASILPVSRGMWRVRGAAEVSGRSTVINCGRRNLENGAAF